jgi:teichuronic acid biosynthesis glycosyltransferase TuaC
VHVLFVTNTYPTSETPGASPCIAQQAQALQHAGYEIDVLFFDGPGSKLNYMKAMALVFWKVQVKNKYDLVHAHYGYSGLVGRAQFRCPVVVTFRGSDVLSSTERGVSRFVAKCVDRNIVMTEEMRKLLGQNDARVIPYGIDLDLFQPYAKENARQELGLQLKIPLVLFPYNPLRPGKKFEFVEQAVDILKEEFPDIQLLAIYNEPHRTIPLYMSACDAMALASDSEGAPVAIREAMACNLPIVSVDVGDVADIIRDTEGCSICSRSPEDMATKLREVLKAQKRTNGRQKILKCGLAEAATEVAAVYQELGLKAIENGSA